MNSKGSKKEEKKKVVPYRFNTFSGVFVPSVLAIFGAVMYYVAPKVIGGVGLIRVIGLILLAHSITIATAYSISSIATNIQVKGGGLYYLISRSLGTEFGASVGVQLFLAQTVAASFYTIAFSKAITFLLAAFSIVVPEFYVIFGSLLFFGILTFTGANLVIKIQYFIFGMIILSLGSIFLAPNINQISSITSITTSSIPFWVAFALFFPAVTGIDAGVGMSGDLKTPRKSLVTGTFASIIFTMAVYLALAVKLSLAATPEQLVSNPFIIHSISSVPTLVILGVIFAASSSALSCLMTAPRSLRAMAKDKMFPDKLLFLDKTIGQSNEPRVALLLSLLIASGVLFFGDLEIVAKIVAMFFLSVYGCINGAAFFEKISRNPSYRPSFNSPASINLYGMIACYAVMYLFNPLVMLIGIAFQAFLFYLFLKTKRSAKIEGVWDGMLFQLLRKVLNRIEDSNEGRKNWRPTIVSFCASENNKTILATILDWITAHRSITKMYFLVPGKLKNFKEKREELETEMKCYIKENCIDVFPRVIISDDFRTSIKSTLQSETIGTLPLNTVLMDFDERFKIPRVINDAINLKKNMIIVRNQFGFSGFKTVDVWWNNPTNGNFMMLIAYLITHSHKWKEEDAVIRLFKVAKTKKELENEKAKLTHIVEQSRIENIEINMILRKGRTMDKIIGSTSRHSDLVILGLPDTTVDKIDPRITGLVKKYSENLKVSLTVLANDQIDFKVN